MRQPPLCTRHHHLKHDTTWQLHYNPTTGTATWTSPTGRKYTNTNPPLPTGKGPYGPIRFGREFRG